MSASAPSRPTNDMGSQSSGSPVRIADKAQSGPRLAVVLSHPTQYYSPWFRFLAERGGLTLHVFYLWNFGVTTQVDQGFKTSLQWDLPLLEGYDHTFVENQSADPGTHHFSGLNNPQLRGELDQFAPDAVLLFGHGWLTNARLLLRGAPHAAALLYRGDSHLLGPQESGLKPLVRRLATRMLLRKVDQFLAVGSANADYFKRHGARNEQITRVPHCVDNNRFQQQGSGAAGLQRRTELGITPEQTVFLFAGKFEEKKRPLDVIRAFRNIQDESAVLLMAGAGPEEMSLKAAAEGNARIRFLPFQNQTAMPGLFAAADVFLLPSFGRQETWGLAVNEAMNCRCAVIVSDHVGCASDLVVDGENGRVISAGSQVQLEGAMRDALAKPERLAQWQERSFQIIDRYSYEAAREGLLEALEVTRRRGQSS